jgi:hypothetical protein
VSQITRWNHMENEMIKLFALATPYSERRVFRKRASKCGGYPDLHQRRTRAGKAGWQRLR